MKSNTRSTRASTWAVLCSLPFALAIACANDDGGGSEDPVFEDGPIYAVNVRTFSPDFSDQISYITLTQDLDAGELTLDQALELPGGGSLWAPTAGGAMYLISVENLTVTKYTLSDSGAIEEAGRVGLSSMGVTQLLSEGLAFDGADRGFLFDLGSAQAIELDLANMEIVGSTNISDLLVETSDVTFLADPGFVRRGDELIGAVYGSNPAFDMIDTTSKIGIFDPSDRSLEVVDAPCGGLLYTIVAENGDMFFSTDPFVAGVHGIDATRAPAPCMARLPAGSREFDPNPVMLNDLTGGATGGLIPGSDGYAYVRVLDQEMFPLTPETGLLEPFSVPAWTTWRFRLADPTTTAERVDRPHIAGGIKFAVVGDQVYQNESSADFSSTTLVRTTGTDAPTPGLLVPGVSWNVVQVR